MEASPRRPRRLAAFAATFTLSAGLAFALVRPGAPEAGAEDGPPLAVSGPVELRGELAGDGHAFTVHVRAVNGGRDAERCAVTATVTEQRDSPMSRVVRLPQPLWTTALALAVEGGAAAEARVAVPADVAGRLREPDGQAPPAPGAGRRARPAMETATHGLRLEATCQARKALG